jgi:hypothetical protein
MWYLHPSSGVHATVSTASGICHPITAFCRYHGRVGTGLSVLWVAYWCGILLGAHHILHLSRIRVKFTELPATEINNNVFGGDGYIVVFVVDTVQLPSYLPILALIFS